MQTSSFTAFAGAHASPAKKKELWNGMLQWKERGRYFSEYDLNIAYGSIRDVNAA